MTSLNILTDTPWTTALLRGFLRRCPGCGEEPMFKGYLTVAKACHVCHLDFRRPPDDGPAYVTMSLVLGLFVPLLLWMDVHYDMPLEIVMLVFLPATVLVLLALLPLVKGAFLAVGLKAEPRDKDD